MDYRNFDVWIEAAGTGQARYRIWASSPLGESPRDERALAFAGPAFAADLQSLEAAHTDSNLLVRLGSGLYHGLFQGDVARLFRLTVDDADDAPHGGVRLRLRLAAPEIGALPWELIYAPDARTFLATDIASPLVRYVEMMARVPRLEAHLPLGLLVAIPSPAPPYPALESGLERQVIERAVAGLGEQVETTFLEGEVTLETVRAALEVRPYHCFHFIGHGGFRDERGHLVFNAPPSADGHGGNAEVDERDLARLFAAHPTMKLVVLNACHGASSSSTRSLTGTAAKLVGAEVPAVIAMQFSLTDEAGVLFAHALYGALFQGPHRGRVDTAAALARAELAESMPGEREMATPVLYMRAPDGILFDPVSGGTLRDLAWSEESIQTERLVARAHERNLAEIEAERHRHPDDAALRAELVTERAEHRSLKRRIRLRNALVLSAVLSVALLSALSVVRLFDVLGLDTKVESWTVALGGAFSEQDLSDEIVLVVIREDARNADDETFATAPRNWRGQHAALLDKLALGEAAAALIGLRFRAIDETEPHDRALVAAVREATAAGMRVILPAIGLDDDRLMLPTPLLESGAEAGTGCFGAKLGVAFNAQMLIETKAGTMLPSAILLAYAALDGAAHAPARFERDDERLTLRMQVGSDRVHEIPLSDVEQIRAPRPWSALLRRIWGGGGEPCATRAGEGDRIASRIVAPYPTLALRDGGRRFSYREVLAIEDPRELRRLFGGRLVILGAESSQRTRAMALVGAPRWGFEIAAEAVGALVDGVTVRSAGASTQFAIMLALGLLGALARYWLPDPARRARRLTLIGVCAIYLAATVVVYANQGLLLNTLYHLGALWLAYWVAKRVQRRWFA